MRHPADPLQAQYDGIPVPCFTWRKDGEFRLERANRAALEQAGGLLEPLIGKRVAEIYPDHAELAGHLENALSTRGTVRVEQSFTRATTGQTRLMDVSYVFVPPDQVMVHADDITERRATEERLRAVISTLESGLLTVDKHGNVTDANPAACRILGVRHEQILADRDWWRPLTPRLEDGTPLETLERDSPGREVLRTNEPRREVAVTFTRPDGDRVSITANYQPLLTGGLVVSITDVTEARRLQERVAHQALHDPLTGLPNRLLFQERLEQALARPLRSRVAVLLVGLDRFRAVNDTHGHQAGDEVLVEVATRLHQVLDVAQPLARFGGDEFAVLAECEDERAAAALAQRLAGALDAPVNGVKLTATIGIAVEHHAGTDLVQDADAALQRVKARGGGAFEVFDRAMEGRLRDRLKLEDGLRRAIERDELRLEYQPIWELDPFRIVAVEALVRWQHPEQGLLAPGRFLPIAEQDARLISAIGDWVRKQAAHDAAHFPEGVRISVNVAARELGDPGFAERVAQTIQDPRRFALEITETTLMEGGDAAIRGLEQLARSGLQVYLDDFGTGYSSLTRLARLPLAGIKLDRGFVSRATGERDRRIIEAALSIGRAAELGVVAEGVETEDQLELLRAAGCRFVQGFLLGRPAPPEQFDRAT
jgi:diguanylate cyclase (GGDEF)-like protein/PAS domain S-box-containing protein